jgi:FkbM family methyltransferase
MIFISYAQNQEDVMLYRALRDVKHGFYIDVGAQDPVIDSVTKAFYDRGWHGINIEPSTEYFQKLQNERPHDINLAIAVGREPGVSAFYEVLHTGLSTTRERYAQRHSEAGYEVQRREVPCTTLDRICAESRVATVHFLKIDVEGAEREVLEGCSFEAVRPWLVLVEATEPNSDQTNFLEWEDLLISRSYRFVYFDGLNRFYAAEEHADLARHLSRPPNVLDDYVGYALWRTRADLEALREANYTALASSLNHMLAEVESARSQAQNLREAMAEREQTMQRALAERDQLLAQRGRQLDSLQEIIAQRERQLGSLQELMAQRDRQLASLQTNLAATQRHLKTIRSSVSWKITSPLRESRRALRRIFGLFRRRKPSTLPGSAPGNSHTAAPDEVASHLTEPAQLLYRNLRDAAALRRDERPVSEERKI